MVENMPKTIDPNILMAGTVGAVVVFAIIIFILIYSLSKKNPTSELEDSKTTEDIESDLQVSLEKGKSKAHSGDRDSFLGGLSKSRGLLGRSFEKIFGSGIDEAVLEEVEEALLTADVGVQTSLSLVEMLREQGTKKSGPELREILRKELRSLLDEDQPLEITDNQPHVIVLIGVNGSGKTTTIGKLAHRLIQEGKTVMMAAGDTFRAGAIDQLRVWAERTGAEFISSAPGADPASVIYNALEAAKSKNIDVLLCDTAGRLQAQQALMEELGKVMRVIKKVIPDAPHETLLVLDATIGQNALSQAKGFMKVAPISGIALTKLDGTAKGGIVLAVKKELGIPVKLVGLGEGLDDLRDFQADLFIEALFPEGEE